MYNLVLIYLTGALCYSTVYPAMYLLATIINKKPIPNFYFSWVLWVVFWPLVLIYILIYGTVNLKYTKKEEE